MLSRMCFATRLCLYIVCTTTCVFLCILSYNYVQTKQSIHHVSLNKATTLIDAATEKIERTLQNVEQVPLYIAHRLATESFTTSSVEDMLMAFVASHPDVYGATIAFAAGASPKSLPYTLSHALNTPQYHYAPYYYKKQNIIARTDLANDAYAYWHTDWFKEPQQAGKALWSEPYFDEGGGNTLMATFSMPVYKKDADGKAHFFAVVTADIDLAWLQQIVTDIDIYDTGYAFILSQKGTFIVQSDARFDILQNKNILDVAAQHNTPWLGDLGQKMMHDQKGVFSFQLIQSGRDMEGIYAPLPSSGWKLALLIPTEEVFAELHKQALIIMPLALVGILGITFVVSLVAHRATRPLRQLSESTKALAKGDLESALPTVQHHDEVGELTISFEHMRAALKEYIADLTRTTAAKERIENELKIAHTIQANFLPKLFPPFPERTEFDIYASLSPAREVGGDLYDFFMLDDDRLFFAVGDVSGKGVPAALVMAVTKTLIKGVARHEHNPAKILQSVNDELAKDNDTCMFVTVFCGTLHVRTGELIYTNAGHNAPLLVRRNTALTALDVPKGMALGIVAGTQYQTKHTQLLPQDTLFTFTDGLTEALSPTREQFGTERLYATLAHDKTVTSMVEDVCLAVTDHACHAEQFDDITLMALRWRGDVKPV